MVLPRSPSGYMQCILTDVNHVYIIHGCQRLQIESVPNFAVAVTIRLFCGHNHCRTRAEPRSASQWFHKKPNLCLTTDNFTLMRRRLRWKMCDQRPRCPATGLPACRLLPPAAGNCRDFSGQQCWNLHSTHSAQCTVQSTQCWNLPKCTITLCPDAHTVHMVNHTCDSKPHGKTQSKDVLLKYCQEESHSIRGMPLG